MIFHLHPIKLAYLTLLVKSAFNHHFCWWNPITSHEITMFHCLNPMISPFFIAEKSPKFTMLKYVEILKWNLHFFRVQSPMFTVQSHDITMNLAFFVGELLRLCCWSPCPSRSDRRLMLRSTPRTSLRSFRCQSRTISFADSCSSWGTGDWVKQKILRFWDVGISAGILRWFDGFHGDLSWSMVIQGGAL